jgi:hypothetical protein
MRDLIWTVIIIWLIFRIADMFKSSFARQKVRSSENKPHPIRKPGENDLKKAVRDHVNREGEYVDFEELK